MWRFSSALLKPRLSVALTHGSKQIAADWSCLLASSFAFRAASFSKISGSTSDTSDCRGEVEGSAVSVAEARKLMHLVNVESLKKSIGMEGKEIIAYDELLEACKRMGLARSSDEAAAFSKVLDEAGVILLFRDRVHLRPDKVAEMVGRVVPWAAAAEDDRVAELKRLKEKKEEIDRKAQRQVRCVLWSGLGVTVVQVGFFFRLTFWEFSWDVMEPIAFFTTAAGIVAGYAYFLFTSRNPTYQDFTDRLFHSRQRKLFRKHNFDPHRFTLLQNQCSCSSPSNPLPLQP